MIKQLGNSRSAKRQPAPKNKTPVNSQMIKYHRKHKNDEGKNKQEKNTLSHRECSTEPIYNEKGEYEKALDIPCPTRAWMKKKYDKAIELYHAQVQAKSST